VVTAAVFLDDVTERNGPVLLIPGSHKHGVLPCIERADSTSGPAWTAHVSASLEYEIDEAVQLTLVAEAGIMAAVGRAGSVLFFDGSVAHASRANLSSDRRALAMFTYNAVENAPPVEALHRPDFLVSRDVDAVTPVIDAALSDR
jgi:ectoine hydroxylase